MNVSSLWPGLRLSSTSFLRRDRNIRLSPPEENKSIGRLSRGEADCLPEACVSGVGLMWVLHTKQDITKQPFCWRWYSKKAYLEDISGPPSWGTYQQSTASAMASLLRHQTTYPPTESPTEPPTYLHESERAWKSYEKHQAKCQHQAECQHQASTYMAYFTCSAYSACSACFVFYTSGTYHSMAHTNSHDITRSYTRKWKPTSCLIAEWKPPSISTNKKSDRPSITNSAISDSRDLPLRLLPPSWQPTLQGQASPN